jgi:2-oxoglutarate dehydrogenase E2 component (dihydrolipoamide succinyltransferase)
MRSPEACGIWPRSSMSSTADVIAPVNEEGSKATILKWLKAVGDSIRKDEPLLELETDKVTVEISSPATGELFEILKQPDEEVLPGQLLARVRIAESSTATSSTATSGTATSSAAPPPQVPAAKVRAPAESSTAPAEDGRLLLSPSVRKLLDEHGLSPADVAGSGRNGRITSQDVLRYVDEITAVHHIATHPYLGAGGDDAAGSRVSHTPIRRRVAEHVARSLALAPHVTTLFEADLTRVRAHRALHAVEFERQGVRLTLTAYFVAACARALIVHPLVNATFHEDALELHTDANIGVGTALGNDGLIVPVIRRAQALNLLETARQLGQLVTAARANKLAPQDVRGGTFTISNHGVGGSLLAAPIVINQPQVAILGIGKVERRVCVLETQGAEAIGIRSMCYLTLTIDHRALDAFQANAFLAHVVNTLEKWDDAGGAEAKNRVGQPPAL